MLEGRPGCPIRTQTERRSRVLGGLPLPHRRGTGSRAFLPPYCPFQTILPPPPTLPSFEPHFIRRYGPLPLHVTIVYHLHHLSRPLPGHPPSELHVYRDSACPFTVLNTPLSEAKAWTGPVPPPPPVASCFLDHRAIPSNKQIGYCFLSLKNIF